MTRNIKLLSMVLMATAALLLFTSLKPTAPANHFMGAWGYGPDEARTVMIATGSVFSVATYNLPGKKFISTYGGTWRMEGGKLVKKIEWNSTDSTQVGREITEDISFKNNALVVAQTGVAWSRLDDGTPGELMGAWVITGNFKGDTAAKRASPFYPRRTMKVLSGKYFQWIAYNVATKTVANAGGGAFTTTGGKYTETIAFFTKTAESVGKSLQFDYSFVKGDWRHRGQKSTGGELDECWSRRETLE